MPLALASLLFKVKIHSSQRWPQGDLLSARYGSFRFRRQPKWR